MMKFALSTLTIVFAANTAFAEFFVYKLKAEREGAVSDQLVANIWQGEYPSPVIDIQSETSGTTTIQGWTSLGKMDQRVSCTVPNGLYHPWSDNQSAVLGFYTVAPIKEVDVIKNPSQEVNDAFSTLQDDQPVKLQAGDQIVDIVYWSEGIFYAALLRKGEKIEVNFYDGAIDNSSFFKVSRETQALVLSMDEDAQIIRQNEQWIQLQCAEGHKMFVQDLDLIQQEGIKLGIVTDFGSISADDGSLDEESK